MFLLRTLPILAVAGSALAAPVAQEHEHKAPTEVERRWEWHGKWHHGGWGHADAPVTTTTEITTATAYVTAGAEATPADTTAPAPTPAPEAPQQQWSPPAPAPSPEAPAPAPEAPAPAPAAPVEAAPASSWAAPAAEGTGYMATVDKWRSAFGLGALTQDSKLEANALKTSQDSGGALKHELNPGSFAQVLAPGNADNFESVYVGGWLCEVPSSPALAGVCDSAGQGWAHNGETGHFDILTSSQYSKIGCALASGIWACDLA